MAKKLPRRIFVEEIVNSLTHGIGLVLSVAGFAVLLVQAAKNGTAWHIVGCTVYGCTLICLYLASTLYHGIPAPRLKQILRIVDHSAIYLLIAGTYTPFLLVNLRGGWGWSARNHLGMRDCRDRFQAVVCRPLQPALDPALYRHGLACCRGHQASPSPCFGRRTRVAAGRRPRVHRWRGVLRHATNSLQPWHLALICASRQFLPLPGRAIRSCLARQNLTL